MDEGSRLPWIIAVILLFCAVFCAITEISFASSSRPRLKVFAEAGNRKAKTALYVLDNFEKAISTILIVTNIVHISIASIVTLAVTKRWGLGAVPVSTIITTMIVFFAGEMLPKSIAKNYAEPLAMFCAGPLQFFMAVFSPLSALLSAIGTGVSKLVKGEPELSVTEDELYDIIEDMTEEGSLDEQQGELISSALQFGDLTVESILTPRVDIVTVDAEDPIEDILAVVRSCTHSRLPVYEGSVDNIIGILSIRRFIKSYLKEGASLDLRSLLDEPFFIHQSVNVDDLLPTMTHNRQSIAVVTDNYGGTLGIVTVEDIVEEIVGEIWDEDDVVEENIVALGDGSFSVDADVHVSDAFDEIGFEDPEDDETLVNTVLGAWAFGNFGTIPKAGDSFSYFGLDVEVETMDHNRIIRLHLTPPSGTEEGGEEQ